MKRTFFLFISILFAILIISKTPVVRAEDTVVQTDTPIGTDAPATQSSSVVPERVNYELPYPGMLPDNPLYILKVIRDGLVKMLINDPFKRAQFSLLSSDKRMYAGKMLVEKGKDKLAIETIAKSNNYLDDAIVAIQNVKKLNPKNTDFKPFLQQMKSAAQKHRDIIDDLKPSIDKEFLQQYLLEAKRIDNTKKIVESLLIQK